MGSSDTQVVQSCGNFLNGSVTSPGSTGSALVWHSDGCALASLVICGSHFHRAIRGAQAQGVLPCGGGGVVTACQSIGLSVVTGSGRLQLGASHWATSVALLQAVDN